MKKLIMAAAILGASVSGAEAAVMNFSGVKDYANEVDYFFFQNNSVGDVQIVMDTLSDGYDATLGIWKKVEGSSVAGLPEDSDWELIDISYAAPRTLNSGDPVYQIGGNLNYAFNDFGIPLRNGFVGSASPVPTGTSDPGTILTGLASGIYLIDISGDGNNPNAFLPGDRMSLGYLGFETFSINQYPHNYTFTVSGDVSEVSQVPLPAAIWLFGSALAGLGTISRKKSAIAA